MRESSGSRLQVGAMSCRLGKGGRQSGETWVTGQRESMSSGNCALVTRNEDIRRPCSRPKSSLMWGYMMGSPTRDSAQCRTRMPSSRRSSLTPATPQTHTQDHPNTHAHTHTHAHARRGTTPFYSFCMGGATKRHTARRSHIPLGAGGRCPHAGGAALFDCFWAVPLMDRRTWHPTHLLHHAHVRLQRCLHNGLRGVHLRHRRAKEQQQEQRRDKREWNCWGMGAREGRGVRVRRHSE